METAPKFMKFLCALAVVGNIFWSKVPTDLYGGTEFSWKLAAIWAVSGLFGSGLFYGLSEVLSEMEWLRRTTKQINSVTNRYDVSQCGL